MVLVEVTGSLEERLRDAAERLGLSVTDYARRLLEMAAPQAEPVDGATLVEMWKAEGLIGTRPDIDDAAEHARRIRGQAEHREREP
jgi:hypothetical protein